MTEEIREQGDELDGTDPESQQEESSMVETTTPDAAGSPDAANAASAPVRRSAMQTIRVQS